MGYVLRFLNFGTGNLWLYSWFKKPKICWIFCILLIFLDLKFYIKVCLWDSLAGKCDCCWTQKSDFGLRDLKDDMRNLAICHLTSTSVPWQSTLPNKYINKSLEMSHQHDCLNMTYTPYEMTPIDMPELRWESPQVPNPTQRTVGN